MHEEILALIPARGGSKGIPKKNLVKVGGVSLLERAVNCARRSNLPEPLVSTDDEDIVDECRRIGVGCIHRPSVIAEDDTPMIAVIRHAVEHCETVQAVCLLQPTNPLRTHHIINECLAVWHNKRPGSLACRAPVGERHPARMTYHDGGHLKYDDTERNRQELQPVYLRDGACYIVGRPTIDRGTMYSSSHEWVTIEPWRSWNVDEYWDIPICEALLAYDKNYR